MIAKYNNMEHHATTLGRIAHALKSSPWKVSQYVYNTTMYTHVPLGALWKNALIFKVG